MRLEVLSKMTSCLFFSLLVVMGIGVEDEVQPWPVIMIERLQEG